MLVWALALAILLDKLLVFTKGLAADLFDCSFYEGVELVPCELSPSEIELWIFLLGEESWDPGVSVLGRFV